jgi:hypothetical protein
MKPKRGLNKAQQEAFPPMAAQGSGLRKFDPTRPEFRLGMKKGGMATKKKAGKISEYGGKEMYSSKKAMMKHEGMEGMKMEKSEGMKMRGGGMAAKGKGLAMKKGGMAPKGRGMAIMIAIGKPKGRGKS